MNLSLRILGEGAATAVLFCFIYLIGIPLTIASIVILYKNWRSYYFIKRNRVIVVSVLLCLGMLLLIAIPFSNTSIYSSFLDGDEWIAAVFNCVVTYPCVYSVFGFLVLRFWLFYFKSKLMQIERNRSWRLAIHPIQELRASQVRWYFSYKQRFGNAKFLFRAVVFSSCLLSLLTNVFWYLSESDTLKHGHSRFYFSKDFYSSCAIYLRCGVFGAYGILSIILGFKLKYDIYYNDTFGIKHELLYQCALLLIFEVSGALLFFTPIARSLYKQRDEDQAYATATFTFIVVAVFMVFMYLQVIYPKVFYIDEVKLQNMRQDAEEERKRRRKRSKWGRKKKKLRKRTASDRATVTAVMTGMTGMTGIRGIRMKEAETPLLEMEPKDPELGGDVQLQQEPDSASQAARPWMEQEDEYDFGWQQIVGTFEGYEALMTHCESEFSFENLLVIHEYMQIKGVLKEFFTDLMNELSSETRQARFEVSLPPSDNVDTPMAARGDTPMFGSFRYSQSKSRSNRWSMSKSDTRKGPKPMPKRAGDSAHVCTERAYHAYCDFYGYVPDTATQLVLFARRQQIEGATFKEARLLLDNPPFSEALERAREAAKSLMSATQLDSKESKESKDSKDSKEPTPRALGMHGLPARPDTLDATDAGAESAETGDATDAAVGDGAAEEKKQDEGYEPFRDTGGVGEYGLSVGAPVAGPIDAINTLNPPVLEPQMKSKSHLDTISLELLEKINKNTKFIPESNIALALRLALARLTKLRRRDAKLVDAGSPAATKSANYANFGADGLGSPNGVYEDSIDAWSRRVCYEVIRAFQLLYGKYIDDDNGAIFLVFVSHEFRKLLKDLFDTARSGVVAGMDPHDADAANDEHDEEMSEVRQNRGISEFGGQPEYVGLKPAAGRAEDAALFAGGKPKHRRQQTMKLKDFANATSSMLNKLFRGGMEADTTVLEKEMNRFLGSDNDDNNMKNKHLFKWLLTKIIIAIEPSLNEISELMDDSFKRFKANDKELYKHLCVEYLKLKQVAPETNGQVYVTPQ